MAEPAYHIRLQGVEGSDKSAYKPLCLIMQFAPALFPEGDFDRLSELDRQRLVTFIHKEVEELKWTLHR